MILLAPLMLLSQQPAAPLMSVVDLDKGRPVEVKLHNGDKARIELLERTETFDNVRGAVRNARVRTNAEKRRPPICGFPCESDLSCQLSGDKADSPEKIDYNHHISRSRILCTDDIF